MEVSILENSTRDKIFYTSFRLFLENGYEATNIRDICKEAGALVWFKQAGTHLARKYKMSGKGENLDQIPQDLRLRERPDLVKK